MRPLLRLRLAGPTCSSGRNNRKRRLRPRYPEHHCPADTEPTSKATAPPPSLQRQQTPLMRQYSTAKQQNPDALLFFRLGDFYELFLRRRKNCRAQTLGITLTARDRERAIPMCGVPFHAAEGLHRAATSPRLPRRHLRADGRPPKLTKKIVRREVTRVLTPGTVADNSLGAGENNYLAALYIPRIRRKAWSLRWRCSTSRPASFAQANGAATPRSRNVQTNAPTRAPPRCAAARSQSPAPHTRSSLGVHWNRCARKHRWKIGSSPLDYAVPLLERQLGALSLDGFGLAGHTAAAIAAGAVLHYAQTTQHARHWSTYRLPALF